MLSVTGVYPNTMMQSDGKLDLFELTFSELTEKFKNRYGRSSFHSSSVYREVYKKGNLCFEDAPEFVRSQNFYRELQRDLRIDLSAVIGSQMEDGVIKFFSRLSDGYVIESVIVPMATHATVCVSTQVGCKMGCKFCETARMGFKRNLSVGEIISQVFNAKFTFRVDIRNIVFMGMGEPFDNFDNVAQSIRVLEDQRGFAIAKRYISVSTVGRVDGINKLAAFQWPSLNLAVSLNAPNDQIRSRLMPINSFYPMGELMEALLHFPMKKNGAIYVEYVLIKNVNDRCEHARELAEYLKPIRVKVNLIPYNPRKNAPFESPGPDEVDRFLDWLVEEKVFVRKRSSKGCSIMAGCGQLGSRASELPICKT